MGVEPTAPRSGKLRPLDFLTIPLVLSEFRVISFSVPLNSEFKAALSVEL